MDFGTYIREARLRLQEEDRRTYSLRQVRQAIQRPQGHYYRPAKAFRPGSQADEADAGRCDSGDQP